MGGLSVLGRHRWRGAPWGRCLCLVVLSAPGFHSWSSSAGVLALSWRCGFVCVDTVIHVHFGICRARGRMAGCNSAGGLPGLRVVGSASSFSQGSALQLESMEIVRSVGSDIIAGCPQQCSGRRSWRRSCPGARSHGLICLFLLLFLSGVAWVCNTLRIFTIIIAFVIIQSLVQDGLSAGRVFSWPGSLQRGGVEASRGKRNRSVHGGHGTVAL